MWSWAGSPIAPLAPGERDQRPAYETPCAYARYTAPSGDAPAGGLQDEPHVHTKARQHVDQTICAEQIDPSSQQIADARLRHAEDLTADNGRMDGAELRLTPRRDALTSRWQLPRIPQSAVRRK